MAKNLRKEARRGEDGGVIETISSQMLRGLSNVFLAYTSGKNNRSQEKEKEAFQVKFFASKAFFVFFVGYRLVKLICMSFHCLGLQKRHS